MPDWDLVVIGGGPAGLSAAAAAARMGLACLVVDRMGGGGELMNLGPLHDLDTPETGPGLAARLLEEAISVGAELGVAEITGLVPELIGWCISTDTETHHARAVIVATGLAHGTLGLVGEQDFEGLGLSHCAACDGPLYAGQPVVVAGADLWAQQEARELAAIASEVTLVTQGAAAPAIENVAVIRGRITALEGTSGLTTVVVRPDDSDSPRRLPAQAVFVQTGRRPALGFAPDALARDPDGRLVTGDVLQTNMSNLFAAGDARAGAPRTLAAAMAEGRRAAASARDALNPIGFPLGKNAIQE